MILRGKKSNINYNSTRTYQKSEKKKTEQSIKFCNIANIHYDNKEYEKAVEFYSKSIA